MMERRIGPYLLLLCTAVVAADDAEPKSPSGPAAQVAGLHREHSAKAKDNPDLLALPGLLADRKAGKVRVYAEATGVGPQDIIEFFLISQNSGHDYEAMATSYAKPSDVHRALMFVGMEPGRPVDGEKLRFWPKGERVIASVSDPSPDSSFGPVRFEKLIVDKKTGKPWFENGLVFVGSEYVDSPDNPGEKVYAADLFGPNSIASNYNEPTTVLDVPRQAMQAVVYGGQALNEDIMLPTNALLEIVFEPERKDGTKRVVDLDLAVSVKPEAEGLTLNDVVFDLTGDGNAPRRNDATLNDILETSVSLVADGRDPFVTLSFGDGLSVGAIHELCGILDSIETERGIRVEPPPEGQLYYRAFLPNEEHRDREKRIAQPWELHLCRKDSGIVGTLIHIEQLWNDNSIEPDLKLTERSVSTPEELKKGLDEMGNSMPVILVYSPRDVTYGELMALIADARSTHPVIHVFLEAR